MFIVASLNSSLHLVLDDDVKLRHVWEMYVHEVDQVEAISKG